MSLESWQGRRELTQRLTRGREPQRPVTGTVTAVTGTLVTVTLGGAPVDLPYLSHYTPAVGDTVVLLWLGTSAAVVIGAY